jgi:hypothetical protein
MTGWEFYTGPEWQEPSVKLAHEGIECPILVPVEVTDAGVRAIRDLEDLIACNHPATKFTNARHRFVPFVSSQKTYGCDVVVGHA